MAVVARSQPPRRLEGGGFEIMDLLSDFKYQQTDPFLMWHELPKKTFRPGEFPGAPLHPHRGFCEVPYCRIMSGNGQMKGRVVAAGTEKPSFFEQGDLEFGLVGSGMSHEALLDSRWGGEMHFFQMWINLPKAHKMDPPEFQNARSHRLPKVEIAPNVVAKVLVGSFGDIQSPVTSPHVKCLYMDIEAGANCQIPLPPDLTSKWVNVYQGRGHFGKESVRAGEVVQIRGDVLDVRVTDALGFLMLQGEPLREPVCKYGPFVMSDEREIREAFQEYQQGNLATKKASFKLYD